MSPQPDRRPEDVVGLCIFCDHRRLEGIVPVCALLDARLRVARPKCGGKLWTRGPQLTETQQADLAFGPPRAARGGKSISAIEAAIDKEAVAEFVRRVLESVCELPDRTSPEDQPDMMMLTGEELSGILENHLEQFIIVKVRDDG